MDARLRFTAEDSAELPFDEQAATEPQAPVVLALARMEQPDPLAELRAKVERAELLARQAEANLRTALARDELKSLQQA